MKTLAIILTATLFGAMAWVMMDARSKATSATNQLELFRKQQKNTPGGPGAPAPLPPAMTPEELELAVRESKLLSQQVTAGTAPPPLPPGATSQGFGRPAAGVDPATTAAPPPLTPRQRLVLSAPAIGKVTEFQKEYGFLVFNGGASRKIEAGMVFGVRRGNSIIGRVKVTSVEDASAVADLETQSVPPGVTINVGDDIIQDIPPGI